MNIHDKLLKKYNSSNKLKDLQDKIKHHYIKNKLVFGNKISKAFKDISYLIDNILNNDDFFIECDFCQDKYYIDDLREVNNNKLCEECIDNNYDICGGCGDYVYQDDINIIDDDIYCYKCYFKEKQVIYEKHLLKNILLIDLKKKKLTYNELQKLSFVIDKHYFSIEKHNGFYRLGSFGANFWLDIGNNIQYVLEAIEVNLQDKMDLLTNITY